jgi:hypothetical protein
MMKPDWRWRWYIAPTGSKHFRIARVWNDRAVSIIAADGQELDLASDKVEAAVRAYSDAVSNAVVPEWNWHWYVLELGGADRYKIARVWSNQKAESVNIEGEILLLAKGETKERIDLFVRTRLPRP